jgi:hypothetical protein
MAMATPLVLLNVCIDMVLTSGSYDPFTATITPGSDWKVVVTPTIGDPDLYVNVDPSFAYFPGPSYLFQFSSAAAGVTVESVAIPAPATDTEIRIGVVAEGPASYY